MATATKGLIYLEPKSSILYEQLQPRIIKDETGALKREPCEISFNDFDDVSFKIVSLPDTPHLVTINMGMKNVPELKKLGTSDLIARLYPGWEVTPAQGYNIAIQVNCDTLTDPVRQLTTISEFRKNVFGGPLDRMFNELSNKTSDNLPPVVVEYRKNEAMFICPTASKIIVIFAVDFADITDKALAKVFLQEFVEAQRVVRNSPPVSYSKEPPGELTKVSYAFKQDIAGYLSFSVEERHIVGPGKDKAIALFTGFRNYLHYHIKCSKTYLHMRMRKKVAGWMQVLNRAVPDIEGEKKTASGKTFVKK